ncbi:YTH domain-containing protein ECT2-like isoform X2 [Tripterygium wilfordii]|uniref:YTH domain-containing protein ECT2-like isoform X2 n=1 Tax=Tripterygium wilfordii TaxID=458696 RepID=UPI0018F80561|nr:YTH domain-containing protein ECT2-like isoform X2 [Tripterygium wilfordii]
MATVAPTADQAAGLLQNLSLDSQAKAFEIPVPTKKPAANQFGSVDLTNVPNGQNQSFERSVTPLLSEYSDPYMCYLQNGYQSAYYFAGYNDTGNEGDDYTRYVNPGGVEMTNGVYGENGSVLFHHGFRYPSYGPYSPATSPVPTIGNDGQLYGPQHYQYPHYFQPMTPSSGPLTPSPVNPSQAELSTSAAADQKPLPVEAVKKNSNSVASGGGLKGNNLSVPFKPAYQNTYNSNNIYGRSALPGGVPPSNQDPRFGFDGARSPIPWLDGFSDGLHRPVTNHGMTPSYPKGLHHPSTMSGLGSAHGYVNRMYPNKLYGQYANSLRTGMGVGSGGYDSRTNGRGWLAVDGKYRPKGRGGYFGYGNENADGLNELNRGPRAKSSKNQKGFAPNTIAVKGQNVPTNAYNVEETEHASVASDREPYNSIDFPEDYSDAKFFIIKSYSEDDVHKSIKYNVWASTPNGNKKLDAAYQESQQNSGGCPVFLFFSVNTSGQFVGLAEMVGPVDFNKNIEYWQQDKWTGCFPVKWHIVKDVPNSLLRHITLENNENKPVTNSRDTQEVKLEQGLKMIKAFKDHSSKTCILDDFIFYETRQKSILEKKAKQQQFQKQVWEGKASPEKKEEANDSPKPLEAVSVVRKDTNTIAQPNGEVKHSENGSVANAGDGLKGSKPVLSEETKTTDGVANGC